MTPTPPCAITPDRQDRYGATDVRAYAGWNAKGVALSGSDPDAPWANPPRPREE